MKRRKKPAAMELLFQMEFTKACHFPIDRKAQSAYDNQENSGEIDDGIGYITAEAVAPKKVDSRIAEGGNRMENAVPDSRRAVLRDENQEITQSPQSFKEKGYLQDAHGQPHKAGEGIQIVSALNQHPVREGNPAAEDTQDNGGKGYDSQTAELDQKQDNRLTEKRKSPADIYGGKPCDAYAGHSHKKRVNKVDFYALPQTHRKTEQDCPDQGSQKKAQHNNSGSG